MLFHIDRSVNQNLKDFCKKCHKTNPYEWRHWSVTQEQASLVFMYHTLILFHKTRNKLLNLWIRFYNAFIINNNNLLHSYGAFSGYSMRYTWKWGISSTTTNVQHPPGCHSVPEHPPHFSLLVERRQWSQSVIYI